MSEENTGLHTALIALGANLGNPRQTLLQAVDSIAAMHGTNVVAVSSWYGTEPIDSFGPDYVNGVMKIRTTLSPKALLVALQKIENRYGRVRPTGVHNAPRTLDLDVIGYDDLVSADPDLTLPHPRAHERAFVLVPLSEIDPDYVIAGHGSVRNLLAGVASQRIERL